MYYFTELCIHLKCCLNQNCIFMWKLSSQFHWRLHSFTKINVQDNTSLLRNSWIRASPDPPTEYAPLVTCKKARGSASRGRYSISSNEILRVDATSGRSSVDTIGRRGCSTRQRLRIITCVGACVRVCVRLSVRTCVRPCMCACVCVCVRARSRIVRYHHRLGSTSV